MSESLAFEACAELANEILAAHNISDRYTGPQLLGEFVGQNFRGMMKSLEAKYKFTIPSEEFEKYVSSEEDKVIEKLNAALVPCDGVMEILEQLQKEGKYHMAVVSSSAYRRVMASIKKADMTRFFKDDEVFSAATSLPKPTSKPDPAIYLHAMEKLGKKPEECVAIEDSKSGTTAGARAGIKVIGYVGPYEEDEKEKMKGVLKLAGAGVIMEHWKDFPKYLAEVEGSS